MILARRFAPVCYFVYARPTHARMTLAALTRCEQAKDTDLLVFSDAPRSPAVADQVTQVRTIVHAADGFRSVKVFERAVNFGLSRSIIEGVTEAFQRYSAAIVVEDDVLVSSHFLRFMNESLTMYEADDRVCGISGYTYPVSETLPDQFFLAHSDCWGWATWARAWSSFEPDGAKLLAEIEARQLAHQFNFDGAIDLVAMLRDQISGRNDSWAVRWAAINFLRGKLTLYPGISMISNIGNDGSGQHGGATTVYDAPLAQRPLLMRPIPVKEDQLARQVVVRFLCATRPTLIRRIAGRLSQWSQRKLQR